MEKCVENCEFIEFNNGSFYCKFYESDLKTELDIDSIILYKCKKCIEEGKIGSDKRYLLSIKIKKQLGWLMDSFYSFKDDIEKDATEIYRIIRNIEDEHK